MKADYSKKETKKASKKSQMWLFFIMNSAIRIKMVEFSDVKRCSSSKVEYENSCLCDIFDKKDNFKLNIDVKIILTV